MMSDKREHEDAARVPSSGEKQNQDSMAVDRDAQEMAEERGHDEADVAFKDENMDEQAGTSAIQEGSQREEERMGNVILDASTRTDVKCGKL